MSRFLRRVMGLIWVPLVACGGSSGSGANLGSGSAASTQFQVVTLASGLENPWGLAFLPDGRMLVTERAGRLRVVNAQGVISAPLSGLPGTIDVAGQGGLLGLALDPAFATNRRIYLSFAERGQGPESGLNSTAVWRAELSTNATQLLNGQVIFRQLPKVDSSGHFGGRLVFDRQGALFVTLGDRQSERDQAQNKANHQGKVVRILTNGSTPADNPWVADGAAASGLWSIGHRNVQGAATHPTTGELWTHEHGPQGGDEVNITRKGRNYGWPVITHGCEYVTCSSIGDGTTRAGMEQPVTWWPKPSTAPSGMAFYTSDKFPAWTGNLFVGALAGQTLWRLSLSGDQVVATESLLEARGQRIRDVVQGPDGWLYLLTDSSDGQILRLQSKP